MNVRKHLRFAVGGAALWILAVPASAFDVGGRVWNDVDRNGLQDVGETGITNIAVRLFDSVTNFISLVPTDSTGSYVFPDVVAAEVFLQVIVPPSDLYEITLKDVGGDDAIDNDFADNSRTDPFAVVSDLGDVDCGLYKLVPAMTVSPFADGVPLDTPFYATNGQVVEVSLVISNAGDTALDDIVAAGVVGFEIFLPNALDCIGPGSEITYFEQVEVTSSIDQAVSAYGFPADFLGCANYSISPLVATTNIVIMLGSPSGDTDGDLMPDWWEDMYGLSAVVSNAHGSNADSDWMTDLEEYWADTDPTNGLSYFPDAVVSNAFGETMLLVVHPSSTQRVYHVRWATELFDGPQNWQFLPPERTGTGGAISFTVTNDSPGRSYRTGVSLP